MNCDCFEKLIERLKKENPEWKEIMLDRLFDLTGKFYPFIKCHYKFKEKNKKKYWEMTTNIKANNCPLCGKK